MLIHIRRQCFGVAQFLSLCHQLIFRHVIHHRTRNDDLRNELDPSVIHIKTGLRPAFRQRNIHAGLRDLPYLRRFVRIRVRGNGHAGSEEHSQSGDDRSSFFRDLLLFHSSPPYILLYV